MWQEAKKQEKILRGIMVDYKRRAERRKGYYDKCVCIKFNIRDYFNIIIFGV